jgi:hypothetical protein
MRVVDGGLFTSFAAGLRGRLTSSPPQFGQRIAIFCAQSSQNVHSNEQMRAWVESGGRSVLQHSQPGLNSSITYSFKVRYQRRVCSISFNNIPT